MHARTRMLPSRNTTRRTCDERDVARGTSGMGDVRCMACMTRNNQDGIACIKDMRGERRT